MSRQAVIAAALIVWVTALTHAQGARTVRDGVYTDAQAARGQAIYQKQCVSCHGAKLEGLQGPPLIADVFVSHWHTQPLSDLAGKIRNTMPAGATGTLTPQQSVDLVAFILKSGGFPAGKTDLAADEATLRQDHLAGGTRRRCVPRASPRLSAARQHGAVDARHLLSELESDLHGTDSRSRCARQADSRQPERRVLVRRLGRWYLRWLGTRRQRRARAGRCGAADARPRHPLRERPAGAGHRSGVDQVHRET